MSSIDKNKIDISKKLTSSADRSKSKTDSSKGADKLVSAFDSGLKGGENSATSRALFAGQSFAKMFGSDTFTASAAAEQKSTETKKDTKTSDESKSNNKDNITKLANEALKTGKNNPFNKMQTGVQTGVQSGVKKAAGPESQSLLEKTKPNVQPLKLVGLDDYTQPPNKDNIGSWTTQDVNNALGNSDIQFTFDDFQTLLKGGKLNNKQFEELVGRTVKTQAQADALKETGLLTEAQEKYLDKKMENNNAKNLVDFESDIQKMSIEELEDLLENGDLSDEEREAVEALIKAKKEKEFYDDDCDDLGGMGGGMGGLLDGLMQALQGLMGGGGEGGGGGSDGGGGGGDDGGGGGGDDGGVDGNGGGNGGVDGNNGNVDGNDGGYSNGGGDTSYGDGDGGSGVDGLNPKNSAADVIQGMHDDVKDVLSQAEHNQFDGFKQNAANAEATLQGLNNDIARLDGEATALNNEATGINDQIKAAKTEEDKKEDEIEQNKDEQTEADTEVKATDAEVKKAAEDFKKAQENVVKADGEVETANTGVKGATEGLESSKAENAAAVTNLQSVKATATAATTPEAKEAAQRQIDAANAQVEKTAAEIPGKEKALKAANENLKAKKDARNEERKKRDNVIKPKQEEAKQDNKEAKDDKQKTQLEGKKLTKDQKKILDNLQSLAKQYDGKIDARDGKRGEQNTLTAAKAAPSAAIRKNIGEANNLQREAQEKYSKRK